MRYHAGYHISFLFLFFICIVRENIIHGFCEDISVNLFSNRSSSLSDASVSSPGVVFARRGGEITSEKNGRWRINHEPWLFHVMLMTPPASCVSFAQDAKVQAGTPRGVILLFTGLWITHLLDAIAGNKTLSLSPSTFIYIQRLSNDANALIVASA